MKRISYSVFASLLLTSAAWAQGAPVVEGSAFAPQPAGTPGIINETEAPVSNAAQLELRFSNMEDELRAMRGKNEELSFQIRKLTENNEKMQRDIEMRLNDLEGGKKPRAEETPAKSKAEDAAKEDPAASEKPSQTTAGDGVLRAPSAENAQTPRDLYNHAFRLLNQTKYEEASAAFDSFTKKYPKDPLIGNAYYWQGETYYIRRDYVTAADNFRAGFEALPTGPKAADNLLKLAMSLDALSRGKEACVVLSQIVTKFKKESASVTEKAQSEQKRMGCK